jgi:hypothetical protein
MVPGGAFERGNTLVINSGAFVVKLLGEEVFNFSRSRVEASLEVFPLTFENPEEDGNGTANEGD